MDQERVVWKEELTCPKCYSEQVKDLRSDPCPLKSQPLFLTIWRAEVAVSLHKMEAQLSSPWITFLSTGPQSQPWRRGMDSLQCEPIWLARGIWWRVWVLPNSTHHIPHPFHHLGHCSFNPRCWTVLWDLAVLWFIFPSSASQVYMGLPFCHNFSESLSFWERRVGFSWWIRERLQVSLPRDFGYFPTQEGEVWGSKNMSPRCRHKDCIFLSQANWDNCCN